MTILHPYMGDFIKKAPFEAAKDVYKDIQLINQRLAHERITDFFDNLDVYKFKDGVDPYMVLQLISWCSEGVVNQIQLKNLISQKDKNTELDYNEVIQRQDVDMIKRVHKKDACSYGCAIIDKILKGISMTIIKSRLTKDYGIIGIFDLPSISRRVYYLGPSGLVRPQPSTSNGFLTPDKGEAHILRLDCTKAVQI